MNAKAPAQGSPAAAELRHGVVRTLAKLLIWLILSAAILFGLSGNWIWPSAWAYLAIVFLSLVIGVFTLPAELLNERSSIKQGAKRWDQWIVLAFMIIGVAVQAVAALDVRYGWSPRVPRGVKGVALLVVVASFWLVHQAMRANRFFSPVLRIQAERGHAVVMSGPYAFMRHPGYLGMIASQFAVPVVLGSRVAFLLGFCGNILLVIRTALEDRTLQRVLPGYLEYTRLVRYRLLPGIW